jgi:hypothetical protein
MALLDMQGLKATRGSEDAERWGEGGDSGLSLLACGESCLSTTLCL